MTPITPTEPLPQPRRLLVLGFVLAAGFYLAWRWTAFNPAAPVLSALMWGLEALAIGALIGQAAVVWRTSQRQAPVLASPAPATDVMVWAGQHEPGLLRQALRSAQALGGAKRIFVLVPPTDDGPRLATLQALAADLGCTLVCAQAGADDAAALANQALALGDAPYVAWLDGSHACRRDFLQHTLGHFEPAQADARLAFVQTAPGVPGEGASAQGSGSWRGKGWQRWLGAFAPVLARRQLQLGWDRWNATPWSGSGAVLRRSALLEAGGFAGRGSDLFARTTLRLQARGQHGLWHPERMAFSLAAESEAAAPGRLPALQAWGVLLGEGVPWHGGLSLAQRLRHLADALSASLHLVTSLALMLPAGVLAVRALPVAATGPGFWPELALHLLPVLVLAGLLQAELSAGAHGALKALGHRLADLGGPTQAALLAVNAGVALTAVALLQAGVAHSAPALGPSGLIVLVGWSLVNAVLLGSALAASASTTGRARGRQRFSVTLAGELCGAEGERVQGTVDDLSEQGLRFYGPLLRAIAVGQTVDCTLHLPDGPLAVTGEVRHLGVREDDRMHPPRSVGLQLHLQPPERARIEAFLFSSDLHWHLLAQAETPATPLGWLWPALLPPPRPALARRHWNGAQLRPHVQAEATPVLCAAPAGDGQDADDLVVSHVRLPEQVPLILDVFRRTAVPSRGVVLRRIEDPASVGAQATALFTYRALPAQMPQVPMEYLAAASPFVLVDDQPLVLQSQGAGAPGSGPMSPADNRAASPQTA